MYFQSNISSGGGKDLETAIGFGTNKISGGGASTTSAASSSSSKSTSSSSTVSLLKANSVNTPAFTAKNIPTKMTGKLPGGLVTKANSIGSYDVIKPNYGQGIYFIYAYIILYNI